LRNYKYKPGKYTIIDNLLNPYWEWLVQLIPLWVAPNLLTFIGWLFVILSYVNILRYDYTFQQDIPQWCFLLAAGCIWIYSTLDAIDGKQARRTKSSSPLGQLFDHGCDSFSITFFVLALSQAAKLDGVEVFALFITTQSAMYFSNWSEYNTGVLKTNVGQFGVTEAELSALIVHLLTGIFGQDFWQVKVKEVLPEAMTSLSSNFFF
jgi:phosphatidylglycerophosphate synthase